MADIFISYASADRPFARHLADALDACGWSVWWDHSNLHGGEHFDRVIEEAISTARAAIVIWSPASTKSDWVRAEAAQAVEEKKLVPLRIGMAVLPLRFRNIHTIDLSAWTGETEAEPFQRLVKDLTHYLGPPIPSDRPEHLGIPATPDPRTAVSVEEGRQPAETAPIAEHSQASPSGGSPHASTIAQPISTPRPTSPKGRKRVGTYLAAVAVAGGVVWGMVILGERQQAPTNPPAEATVPKPSDPKPPDPPADATAARAAYERGDYSTVLSAARPAAERGDPVAQYILGNLYYYGRSVAQDYAEARRWYQKAADQGQADAQYNLGWMYHNGQGVPQDYAFAMRWYRKAADQGHAEAQYNLGLLYQTGQGVPQDMAQAQAWMQKAATTGHEGAQKWLTQTAADAAKAAYDRGDYTTALSIARPAAERGDPAAQYIIGDLYYYGRSVPPDYAEAMRWYRKAADQENTDAQYSIGYLYAKGHCVPRDMAQAQAWMQKAAAAGHENAKQWLLTERTDGAVAARAAYDRGDYPTALSLARPAAERGDPVAQYILGRLYENGQGVARNMAQAEAWMQKAAAAGNVTAKWWLKLKN
jgi:TPR repeat protein